MTDLLYVGNLPSSATELELLERFGRSGTVKSVAVVTDEDAGCARRFGLVEMSNRTQAQAAVARLNMTRFDDTIISVSFARADQRRNISGE